jgi:DNA polymerase III epsilon subunit-like protein
VSDTNAGVPSTAANPTFAFHEGLALEPAGRFLWRGDAAALGIEAELLAHLTESGPLCFLDFEATGLDTETEAPIEAGAVLVSPGSTEVAVFNTHIRTTIPLSPFIQRLTGITPADIHTAPALEEVARALDGFIGDVPVVAHNAISSGLGWRARLRSASGSIRSSTRSSFLRWSTPTSPT